MAVTFRNAGSSYGQILKFQAMKTIYLFFVLIAAFRLNLSAQEHGKGEITLSPAAGKVAAADTTDQASKADTSIVKIGGKDVQVTDHNGGTGIVWGKDHHKRRSGKFEGHWEGLEFGFNSFDKPDYSLYQVKDFMSLNPGKSIEVNFNFYQLDIGLVKSYAGLVSGMGLSFDNYRFQNPYTIKRNGDFTGPVALSYDNLSKTKLTASYLNVPVLLEFQIPVNHKEGRLFVNAGVIGGVKIGSHTKVKYGHTKDKDHDGFNMNALKYSASARIGYKDVSVYCNYSLNPLFESGKGPGLTPFSVGISFSN
jgi:hypothetical protein